MPYFFIVPLYVLFLGVLAGAAVLAWCVDDWKPACGYILAGAVGTLPGIVLGNVFVTLAGLVPVWLAGQDAFPDWLQQTCLAIGGVALFIGPFVASAAGIALGFAGGAAFVASRRKARRG